MKVKINQSILDRFGNVTIGVAVFGLDVFSEKLETYCSLNQAALKNQYSLSEFKDIEHIKKWIAIFKTMNAKKRESSVVFLTRYLLKHDSLFRKHPVVDLYNTISVKFGLPMGAYDISKLVGQVELRQAVESEQFLELNGTETEETDANEVVYSDDAGVFCRYWNDKDSDRTKITDDTKQFMFIFDGIDDSEKIQNAILELKNTLEDAKDFKYGILDKQNPQLEL